MGFRFCMRAMSIYLKVRLCHFEFFIRDRLGVRHSSCVSFAPLAPCLWVSSATYILYPPPTISLGLSSFPWGALGCLHGFWALCACFVYRVVGFGYSLPSFSFETDFDFGVARSIFARLALSFVASSTYISLPPPAISLAVSSYPFERV